MSFSTLPFLAFAIFAVVATNASDKGLNNTALYLTINVLFMVLFLGRLEAALLIAFTFWGFIVLSVREIKGWSGAIFGTLATLILFILLKKYRFLPAGVRFESIPAILGLSYVLFRVIHLIVDINQEHGGAPPLPRYLNYVLSCFCLVSGPFQRFGDHEASISAGRPAEPMAPLSRICNGFFKTMIFAPAVLNAHLLLRYFANIDRIPSGVRSRGGLAVDELMNRLSARTNVLSHAADGFFVLCTTAAALVWMAFLYLNFSGYTDIVVGWARLCRLDLPENFNSPIRANSFLEFWNRWHMSMTNWFKTYLFTPTLKWLTVRWPDRQFALINTLAAFIVTFLLMGLWHGPDWPFAVCGLLLAAGAALNHTYRELLRRRLGNRAMAALRERPWYRALAAGLTFTYIAVAIAPFWIANNEYLRLLRDLAGPAITIFAVVCVVTGISIEMLRYLLDSMRAFWIDMKLRGFATISPSASIAIRLNILVLCASANYGGIPDFVYKGF